MTDTTKNPFRALPSVNELADDASLQAWSAKVSRGRMVEAARQVLDAVRRELTADNGQASPPTQTDLAQRVDRVLNLESQPVLQSVINATGIIIHTGLGRSPLAAKAVDAIADVAGHYAPVELDLPEGARGKRNAIVRPLLCELTGAESATVVNNNAAALMIVLHTLAKDREVIVSRGELIEIGGSFRLPDVMANSGAALREVGTTNKTRASDYAAAIGEQTGALLKVHPSNYRIEGFTQSASIASLVEIGRERGVPVIDDVGSGALVDFSKFGLEDEPYARQSVDAGADVVLFSGDKLLGGPQAGIIVGKRDIIERIEKNPLMRALRVDKITLAALGATLQIHRDVERSTEQLPIFAMMHASMDVLETRARAITEALAGVGTIAQATVEQTTCYLGGGSLPTRGMPSVAVRLVVSGSEDEFAHRLRGGKPAVVPRVQDGAVWIEVRTVLPQEDAKLIDALRAAAK